MLEVEKPNTQKLNMLINTHTKIHSKFQDKLKSQIAEYIWKRKRKEKNVTRTFKCII